MMKSRKTNPVTSSPIHLVSRSSAITDSIHWIVLSVLFRHASNGPLSYTLCSTRQKGCHCWFQLIALIIPC
jgi:hypothetical protein